MTLENSVIDLDDVEASATSTYPPQFQDRVKGRLKRRLSQAAGLSNLAVLVVELPPGAATSLRLWQSDEDEFYYVLDGTPTLVTDEGEVELRPRQGVGFPAGRPVGHHIVNKSDSVARVLEAAAIAPNGNVSHYTEDDLMLVPGPDGRGRVFVHRDGSPY